MERFWSPAVKRYYVAVLVAAVVIDIVIEPWLDLHRYTKIWNVTGVVIRGDPLFVDLQYPITAAIWVGIPRALQRLTNWRWRVAYYGGFVVVAIGEELLNKYVVRFWYYTDRIAWTDSFWVNLPIIILLGWLTWALLGDLIATGYTAYRKRF